MKKKIVRVISVAMIIIVAMTAMITIAVCMGRNSAPNIS